MQKQDIREMIRGLHDELNSHPHNTPEGREERSRVGRKIERLQVAYENMEEGGG